MNKIGFGLFLILTGFACLVLVPFPFNIFSMVIFVLVGVIFLALSEKKNKENNQ